MNKDALVETIAVYDALGAKYADKIAHVRLPTIPEFMDMLPPKGIVLDVGCAAGRDSAILRDAGFTVTGIDLSTKLLELAREKVPGVEFQQMDARKLIFEDDTFDGIWANAVLLNQDREEIPSILSGFYRVLKANGVCFAGVKEGSGEKIIGEPLVANMKRRETYFEKQELEIFFENAGFKIVNSYPYGDVLGRSTTNWIFVFARK